MRMHSKNHKGFTLIELMVVVAILGILAAIAIPIYRNVVYRGKQTEAKALLMSILVEQDEFRMRNPAGLCYTTTVANLPDSVVLAAAYALTGTFGNIVNPMTALGPPTPNCPNPGANPAQFQAVVTGTLAPGRPVDRWAISSAVSFPTHCDGRPLPPNICVGVLTTEMEF